MKFLKKLRKKLRKALGKTLGDVVLGALFVGIPGAKGFFGKGVLGTAKSIGVRGGLLKGPANPLVTAEGATAAKAKSAFVENITTLKKIGKEALKLPGAKEAVGSVIGAAILDPYEKKAREELKEEAQESFVPVTAPTIQRSTYFEPPIPTPTASPTTVEIKDLQARMRQRRRGEGGEIYA